MAVSRGSLGVNVNSASSALARDSVAALDVAADDDDRADLGDRRCQRGDDRRDDADLGLAHASTRELDPARAQRARLVDQARREALDRRRR